MAGWICSSDNNTLLTGSVTVQLMEGSDTNNLTPVLTIASNIAASLGKVTFTPPSNLPGSDYYAVRVTSSVDGPRYSHQFHAGSPSITGIFSTSAAATSQDASTSAVLTTVDQQGTVSASSSTATSKTSSPKTSSVVHSSAAQSNSADNSSSEVSESDDGLDSSSVHSSKTKTSGGSRPALAAVGVVGAVVAAALF
ncbi:hypothetical protein GGI02_000177 [Coemansia sp. RSA 2322]|nr:hypothetical protein GGI02_000177 [Coemansia sp. RSA 2322]KAJ2480034.1 hypothetical protein EV174_003851 [Coemansia sp. RSA 2320]